MARISSLIFALGSTALLSFGSVWINVDRSELPVTFRHFVGPYSGSVNGKDSTLVATDDRDLGAAQRLWEAHVTPLASGDLRNTRYGKLPDAARLYREAAWLSLQFPLAPDAARDIQTSIWQLFDPYALKPSTNRWLEEAELNYQKIDLRNISIVTSVVPNSSYRIEEFLAIANTGGSLSSICLQCGSGGGAGAFVGGGGGSGFTSSGGPSTSASSNSTSGPNAQTQGSPASNPSNSTPSGTGNPNTPITAPSNPITGSGGPANYPNPITPGPSNPGTPGGPFTNPFITISPYDLSTPNHDRLSFDPPGSDLFGPPGGPFNPPGGPNTPYIDPSVFDPPTGNDPITNTPMTPTPEPQSLILFGTVLIALATLVRRSQKNKV